MSCSSRQLTTGSFSTGEQNLSNNSLVDSFICVICVEGAIAVVNHLSHIKTLRIDYYVVLPTTLRQNSKALPAETISGLSQSGTYARPAFPPSTTACSKRKLPAQNTAGGEGAVTEQAPAEQGRHSALPITCSKQSTPRIHHKSGQVQLMSQPAQHEAIPMPTCGNPRQVSTVSSKHMKTSSGMFL